MVKAKKSVDFSSFMNGSNSLLEKLGEARKEIRKEIKKRTGCINHPDRIIYRKNLCVECDEEDRNLRNKHNAEKEPWVSTDGYKYLYVEDDPNPRLYHRYIVEQYLGRKLEKHEKVSFIDENPRNCELENLAILTKIPVLELPSANL